MQDDKKTPKRPKFDFLFIIFIGIAILGIWLLINNLTTKKYKTIDENTFKTLISTDAIDETTELKASIVSDNYGELFTISDSYKSGTQTVPFKVVN